MNQNRLGHLPLPHSLSFSFSPYFFIVPNPQSTGKRRGSPTGGDLSTERRLRSFFTVCPSFPGDPQEYSGDVPCAIRLTPYGRQVRLVFCTLFCLPPS
ncbi:hypothetical protein MRX96_047105 [Rhipicephalus microplus]